jgi:hypothetical protein
MGAHVVAARRCLMGTTGAVPWGPLAVVAGGVVTYVVGRRAVHAAVRAALGELDYRASDLGSLITRRR